MTDMVIYKNFFDIFYKKYMLHALTDTVGNDIIKLP